MRKMLFPAGIGREEALPLLAAALKRTARQEGAANEVKNMNESKTSQPVGAASSSNGGTRKYFDPGDCFCEVKCLLGHRVRLFNIHKAHFVACDTCKVYVWVGTKLMSTWRYENEDTWQANWESIRGYKEVCL